MKEMSEKHLKKYEKRMKFWYKHYPFIHPSFSTPFEKLHLTKLYFKLEEVWSNYPAFWIAHYILKNRCEFCKYWNWGSSNILDIKNKKIVVDETTAFCFIDKKFYHYHDWCCSFKKR